MRPSHLPLVLGLALAPLSATAQTVPDASQPQPQPQDTAAPAQPQAVTPPQAAEAQAATQDATAETAPDAAQDAAPTQEELDYQALYGGQVYDPVADPTLPAPAQLPDVYDPWEKFNRKVHAFNNVVDAHVAKPLAHAYVAVVPRPVRLGVSNFFSNLGQPVNALNSLLQGRPADAGKSLARFLMNTTLGLGGILDPATDAHLPYYNEDFGQTLGKWGWKRSRYVELPLFGPRTVRDVFGLVGDAPLSPIRQVEDDPARVFLQGLQLVDVRTQLFAVDSMREGATDDYALVRDGWMQRRKYQISGDTQSQQDDSLPEYLQEDTANPSVPADAMPVIPPGSN
jgi:phospholipid-binding lipoprotein MlaA